MSLPLSRLFAAFTVDLPKPNRSFGRVPGLILSDLLLIIGVGLGLLVLLAGAIYFWMKFRRRRRGHVSGGEKVYRGARDSEQDEADQEEEDRNKEEPEHGHHHSHGRRRYKYRVRRRGHRSRNPTLSETGGLPPARPQEPTKPY
jgi:hypothetical protein